MQHLIRRMNRWFAHVPGKYVLATEQTALQELLSTSFGYYLLQLAGPGNLHLAAASRIKNQLRISPEEAPAYTESIQANLDALPVASDSVDLILLAHALEFAEQPQAVLAESYRTLIPEGRVIIFGFNARSLWGLARKLSRHDNMPWAGRFYSSRQIESWLKQLDFSIEQKRTFFYRPPSTDEYRLQQWHFLEGLGPALWSKFGGIFMIVARKTMTPLTPIDAPINRRGFNKKVAMNNRYVEPTT